MNTIIRHGYWILRNDKDVAIRENDTVYDRMNIAYTIKGGRAPHKAASTGKVWVNEISQEFYPSVFNLHWHWPLPDEIQYDDNSSITLADNPINVSDQINPMKYIFATAELLDPKEGLVNVNNTTVSYLMNAEQGKIELFIEDTFEVDDLKELIEFLKSVINHMDSV